MLTQIVPNHASESLASRTPASFVSLLSDVTGGSGPSHTFLIPGVVPATSLRSPGYSHWTMSFTNQNWVLDVIHIVEIGNIYK